MWIHEGWTTYLESLYVEYMYGHDDALKYMNGYKPKVQEPRPIITERGINATPPQDQYFKGALFLNTLRSVVNDDAQVVGAAPRFLSALQVSEHHDGGRGGVLQSADRHEPDADLRSVSAPHRDSDAGVEV